MLARKWRPQTFSDLVGQDHVVKALVNALESGRLHHAYLFTGIRGVGKTTIARIFAKSLNCQAGVTAEPCGQCSFCQDIEAGRFFDLIEVDAASNNGVDSTRELLDNAQYKPASGRYKVYLIDEVHMFSTSSFNALLKTLEEPPEHVKFLLATTETSKLPATVLSRCLQFNLKAMPENVLTQHLSRILTEEKIDFEPAALQHVARVADGSVRDSLSLVEQMVALGEGKVTSAVVEQLLGVLSPLRLLELLTAVARGDAESAMSQVAGMDEFAPDYRQMLADFLSVLHQVAMQQLVPGAANASSSWQSSSIAELADMLSPEQTQLFYDICLQGQRDLPLAPYPRESFEMTLLRMLHFRPAAFSGGEVSNASATPKTSASDGTSSDSQRTETQDAETQHAGNQPAGNQQSVQNASPPTDSSPAASPQTDCVVAPTDSSTGDAETDKTEPLLTEMNPHHSQVQSSVVSEGDSGATSLSADTWVSTIEALPVSGMAAELAANTGFISHQDNRLHLSISSEHEELDRPASRKQFEAQLKNLAGSELVIQIETSEHKVETLAQKRQRLVDEAQRAAEASIAADPLVQTLLEKVDGEVDQSSIQPIKAATPAPS